MPLIEKRTRDAIVDAALLALAWFFIGWLTEIAAGQSPARSAYGSLAGWWAALYVSRLRRITWFRCALVFVIMLAAFFVLGIAGWGGGHDQPGPGDFLWAVATSPFRAAAFVSPAVVNAAVALLEQVLARPRTNI